MSTTTRHRRPLGLLAVLVVVLVSGGVLDGDREASSARLVETASGGGNNGNGNDAEKSFVVSGSVTGLYPGGTRPLALSVRNSTNAMIRVTSITVTVGSPGGSCPAGALTVGSLPAPLLVPAGGSATTTLPATLASWAPDACQGRLFPLTYGGRAEKP